MGEAVVVGETVDQRAKRRRQRRLFDSVAELYDSSRPCYSEDVVDEMVTTAHLDHRSTVLEVGCGTGQLTQQLAPHGFALTAIDIGPSMVATARRRLAGREVTFGVVSFEAFTADDASFDLIISANAFHWIDPEIRFSKSARLLRPGGWLAVLSLEQIYDEPLGGLLQQMWVARSEDGAAWLNGHGRTVAAAISVAGIFDAPVETSHSARVTLPGASMVALENTRATVLSWDDGARDAFAEELWSHVGTASEISLSQVVRLTMAQVPPRL